MAYSSEQNRDIENKLIAFLKTECDGDPVLAATVMDTMRKYMPVRMNLRQAGWWYGAAGGRLFVCEAPRGPDMEDLDNTAAEILDAWDKISPTCTALTKRTWEQFKYDNVKDDDPSKFPNHVRRIAVDRTRDIVNNRGRVCERLPRFCSLVHKVLGQLNYIGFRTLELLDMHLLRQQHSSCIFAEHLDKHNDNDIAVSLVLSVKDLQGNDVLRPVAHGGVCVRVQPHTTCGEKVCQSCAYFPCSSAFSFRLNSTYATLVIAL